MILFIRKISSSHWLFKCPAWSAFLLPFVFLLGYAYSQKALEITQSTAIEGRQYTSAIGNKQFVLPDVQLDEPLPVDPKVKIGRLNNGLTYYIRENKRPERRAEIRLVVNAGSVLENNDQLGLAHFVEHMAFNGTKKYKKNQLIDVLESFGMRLGPDVNAYTQFDETVYMLQVPTDSLELLRTAIEVLKEWAANVTFDPEEIDKERGVIIEEWRLGRGASARIFDKQFPILLKGSRYAERLPIGKLEVLQNFKHSSLIQFYRDWYRPDLMAVIAVGDFESTMVEKFIKDIFSDIPSRNKVRERPVFDVPDHDETLFAITTDPEETNSYIALVFKHPEEENRTARDYRRSIIENLYHGMFNRRLTELLQSADPPFIFASSGTANFVRGKTFYILQASVAERGFLRGLEALLTEAERVRRFGFTQTELEREKTRFLRLMEKLYKERDKTESRSYASEYTRHYLTGEAIPGIEMEYELTRKFLPTIQLLEINQLAKKWITEKNRVVLVSGPEKKGLVMPTEEELMAMFKKVACKEITPYQEQVSEEPLVQNLPESGSIVEEKIDEELGITRWTLSNGAKVVLKPTDFKNDQVLFSAISPGGTSLVPDSIFIPAHFADAIIGQSGLGKFGPIELQKKLAGKVVQITPTISSLYEGLRGSASPQDLETLFQLIYLYFHAPRKDSTVFLSYQKRLSQFIKNRSLDPESAFYDTLTVTLAQHHFRRQPINERTLEKLDLQKSYDFFKDRFADASDFTFYFVGNFELNQMKEFATKYLASLPAKQRQESWKDVGIRPPKGVIRKYIQKGLEPKSRVQIVFTGPFEWSAKNRQIMDALADVLQLKLREVLREDLGGTYGVSVSATTTQYPRESYRIDIAFGCDPNRMKELTNIVFQQIDSLKLKRDLSKYLVKVKEKKLRDHEKNLKENGYWLSKLQFCDLHGEDPMSILTGPKPFLEKLNNEMIHEAARKYLNPNNVVIVTLQPEN